MFRRNLSRAVRTQQRKIFTVHPRVPQSNEHCFPLHRPPSSAPLKRHGQNTKYKIHNSKILTHTSHEKTQVAQKYIQGVHGWRLNRLHSLPSRVRPSIDSSSDVLRRSGAHNVSGASSVGHHIGRHKPRYTQKRKQGPKQQFATDTQDSLLRCCPLPVTQPPCMCHAMCKPDLFSHQQNHLHNVYSCCVFPKQKLYLTIRGYVQPVYGLIGPPNYIRQG